MADKENQHEKPHGDVFFEACPDECHANFKAVPAPLDSEYSEIAWGCQRPTTEGGKFAQMNINRAKAIGK